MRNDNSADKSYAYDGKSIGDRQNDVDRLLVDQDEPAEKRILGTEVAFPDALRFKGAAPEIANSRQVAFIPSTRLRRAENQQAGLLHFLLHACGVSWKVVGICVPVYQCVGGAADLVCR